MLSGVVVTGRRLPARAGHDRWSSHSPPWCWDRLASAGFGVWPCPESKPNAKRMLAWSNRSPDGLAVRCPLVAGFYALSHGLARPASFVESPFHSLAA